MVFVLTYVSKLLKDVRMELNTVSKRIERLDVLYVELEKRHTQKNEDIEKRFVDSIHEIKTEQINQRTRIEKILDRIAFKQTSVKGEDE